MATSMKQVNIRASKEEIKEWKRYREKYGYRSLSGMISQFTTTIVRGKYTITPVENSP